MKILFINLAIVGVVFLTPYDSLAQTVIGNFYDWSAFHYGSGKEKTCYLASEPRKKSGNYKSRGRTFILVTHRPTKKKFNIFELRAGYTYRKKSEVTVNIDGQLYKLFTDGETAWAYDKVDQSISEMMRRGKSMVVIGFSGRGTKTEDKYSLRGYTAAHKAIGKACGIK
jgi:hypothetical protein